VTVSNVVGQGVFLKARAMTCNVGTPGLVLTAWIVAGLLSLAGALTLAELGAMRPESGGPYAFLRRAYGDVAAFPYAWLALLVGAPASIAALAAGSAIFAHAVAPSAIDGLALRVPGTPLHAGGEQTFAIALTLALAFVNAGSALVNGRISTAFGALKIAMLVAIPLVALFAAKPHFDGLAASAGNASCEGIPAALRGGAGGFAAALIGALYAYLGWASLPMIAGEIRRPGRTIPLALGGSMVAIIVAYVVANASYFVVLSPHTVASLPAGTSVGVAAIERVFGPAASRAGAALLFLSVLSTLHVTILTWARVVYAGAHDGLMPRFFARVSRRTHVPVNAMLGQTAVAIALLLAGTFDLLSDVYTFTSWLVAVFIIAAVFVSRRREPDAVRPYRVFGYPVVPVAFVAVGLWLVVQTLVTDPRSSLLGAGSLALALLVYAIRARALRARTRSV